MLLLGLDIGSSSIKASLVEARTGEILATKQSPSSELPIEAPQPGWAEQHPLTWWHHTLEAIGLLQAQTGRIAEVKAIGISYQMHGLVAVDSHLEPVRPSIIWCDSRASSYGARVFGELGSEYCMGRLLNHPGNFTASKLAWVKECEPENYGHISKIMLPGDFIALKLTGTLATTATGMSEGILWDYSRDQLAEELIGAFGFNRELFPDLVPIFGTQGQTTAEAARLTGIPQGTPVTYRAGDQPNNALSLNVLEPGEVAATAGTSGVIYGILDSVNHDPNSRVNVFAHVNHLQPEKRLGVLLCVNGTGILYSWLRRVLGGSGLPDYGTLNDWAEQAGPGSGGLLVYPFGNGVERIHQNRPFGGQILNLDFNRHSREHIIRAAQEGIVYALNYGFEAMQEMGVRTETVRAGHANLFLSPGFRQIFADVTGTTVELYNTDGAAGAARGAGIGAGIFSTPQDAFKSLQVVERIRPNPETRAIYKPLYQNWKMQMIKTLNI